MSELSEKQRDDLDKDQFAFPKQRKEPLNNASHVRNAIARFDQVEGVSDDERDDAWARIKTAAKKYDVDVSEKSWRELGKARPLPTRPEPRRSGLRGADAVDVRDRPVAERMDTNVRDMCALPTS